MFTGCILFSTPQHILLQVNCTHYNSIESGIESLLIPAEIINNIDFQFSISNTSLYFTGNEEVLLLYLDLLALQHAVNNSSKLKFSLLLQKFLSKINIQNEKDQLSSSQIDILEQYIVQNLQNQLKIQDLAKVLGINQQYLKIRFKNSFGITVHDYIRNKRLDKAVILIRSNCYSLHEIALKIGYSSLSSFSQAFKQKFGESPLSYKISNN